MGEVDNSPKSYVPAENRVISELKELDKPFIILLNSVNPEADSTVRLKNELEEKHGVPVVCVNCEQIDAKDISRVIETVLFEFPVCEMKIKLPGWMQTLDKNHWLSESVYKSIADSVDDVNKVRDVRTFAIRMGESGRIYKSQDRFSTKA